MAEMSQLIQPLVCTQMMSTLTSVLPGVPSENENIERGDAQSARSVDFSRYRQVLLTALPLLTADVLALGCCYFLASLMKLMIEGPANWLGVWKNLFAVCLCHVMVGSVLGLFPASGINPVRELRNQLTSIGASFLLLIALNALLGKISENEIWTMTVAFPLSVLVAPLARYGARRSCSRMSWWGENVIVAGSGQQGRLVYDFLQKQPQRGLKPIGVVDDNPSEYWMSADGAAFELLGKTSDLAEICRTHHCHWVIAVLANRTEEELSGILSEGSRISNFIILNTRHQLPSMWVESFDAAGLAGIHIRDGLLSPVPRLTKRLIDIVAATLILLVASPLLLIISIWMKIRSPGPVFYRHHGRIGRGGRTFGAFKIRTMVQNADVVLREYLDSCPEAIEEWNRDLKLKRDPRIIPGVGHFLRKTSLDELPQLLNILVGDMSLVGPRPIYTENEVAKFGTMFPLYLRVRPGLTGLWQVSGRNNTSYEDRVRLDSYYIRNWSLWLDYFILLRTIRTVLFREGSY